jgi:hypothetical protein
MRDNAVCIFFDENRWNFIGLSVFQDQLVSNLMISINRGISRVNDRVKVREFLRIDNDSLSFPWGILLFESLILPGNCICNRRKNSCILRVRHSRERGIRD